MDAVILRHNIDSPFISHMEQINDKIQFQRIDADVNASIKEETDAEALIAAYESEKAECDRLRAELDKSEAQNRAYEQQIIELERQIDNHRLAGAFLNGDNTESKKKIDRLIKEIDKCISLMEN